MMCPRSLCVESRCCVGCHEEFAEDDIVIGVAVGRVTDGGIELHSVDWRDTDCWTPLPQRQ